MKRYIHFLTFSVIALLSSGLIARTASTTEKPSVARSAGVAHAARNVSRFDTVGFWKAVLPALKAAGHDENSEYYKHAASNLRRQQTIRSHGGFSPGLFGRFGKSKPTTRSVKPDVKPSASKATSKKTSVEKATKSKPAKSTQSKKVAKKPVKATKSKPAAKKAKKTESKKTAKSVKKEAKKRSVKN